ncbi:MAG: hypothetical protein M5U28_56850, partial [Sandaracinaceae bacterium]|nr:hypothetical protein [Sandaracinaceae bacterium]
MAEDGEEVVLAPIGRTSVLVGLLQRVVRRLELRRRALTRTENTDQSATELQHGVADEIDVDQDREHDEGVASPRWQRGPRAEPESDQRRVQRHRHGGEDDGTRVARLGERDRHGRGEGAREDQRRVRERDRRSDGHDRGEQRVRREQDRPHDVASPRQLGGERHGRCEHRYDGAG